MSLFGFGMRTIVASCGSFGEGLGKFQLIVWTPSATTAVLESRIMQYVYKNTMSLFGCGLSLFFWCRLCQMFERCMVGLKMEMGMKWFEFDQLYWI